MKTLELYRQTTGTLVTSQAEMITHFQGLKLREMDHVIGPLVDRLKDLDDPGSLRDLSRLRLSKAKLVPQSLV